MDNPLGLARDTEAAMNDFIGRLAKAQRLSGKRAPSLCDTRDSYVQQSRLSINTQPVARPGLHRENALSALRRFIESAERYRQEALAGGPRRSWNSYEDQRLRKPISRLRYLLIQHDRWEAFRRLHSNGAV